MLNEGEGATDETVVLYRPVGAAELKLIEEAEFQAFPPRLTHQPIFYPVTNEAYAVQIARDWNTRDAASGFVGYVTRFRVRVDFLTAYPPQVVGAARHTEYWIPAEEMDAFNAALVGTIEVTHEFRADA